MNGSWIEEATVTSQDPDGYRVWVTVPGQLGGQSPSQPVRVATHGPRDAVRGHFPELPLPGQTGIVAFTRNDRRNGVWLGSAEPALNDASPLAPGMVGVSYHARYSGAWSWAGPDGTEATVFADGSSVLAGNALPAPTRHTLDQDQVRQRTPYTAAERNPSPPGPMPLTVLHASGTQVSIGSNGNVLISVAAGSVTVDAPQVLVISADVQLGTTSGKKVVLDGDPVIGGGGGHVQATSTQVRAN